MDRNGIVDALARQRRVETVVANLARRDLDAALKDLSQIIYLHLLTMDETKLRDLWDTGDIQFYIVRVAKLQMYGHRTSYDTQVRSFSARSVQLNEDASYEQ